MNPQENIEKLITKLVLPSNKAADERILNDSLAAFEKSKDEKPAETQPNIWRAIMKRPITKSIAAAVIIVVAGIGIMVLNHSDETGEQRIVRGVDERQGQTDGQAMHPDVASVTSTDAKLEVELKQVEQMFAVGNIDGLVTMLSKGRMETKIATANYLAQIGDSGVIAALEQLSEQWQGEMQDNPFAAAIAEIQRRLSSEGPETETTEAESTSPEFTTSDGSVVYDEREYELLQLLPAESLFCVRVNNFDYTLNVIDQFLVGVSPVPMGISMLTRVKFAELLGNPELKGVKMGGHFAIFGTLIDEETTGIDPDKNTFIGIIVPITDYEQLVTANPNCGQGDENGVFKITKDGKELMLIKQIGNHVLATPITSSNGYDKLVSIAKSISTGQAAGLESILNVDQAETAKNEPIWVYGNIQLISQMFGAKLYEQIEQAKAMMIENMKSSGQVEASTVMIMYFSLFEMFVKGTQFFTIVANPEANVCSVSIEITSLPQTELATLFVADDSGCGQNRLLRYLQDGAVMTEAVNIQTPFLERFCIKCADLFTAMCGDDISSDDIAKMKTLTTDIIDCLGGSMVYSLWSDVENQPPFAIDYVFEVRDPNKLDRLCDEAMELFNTGCISTFYKKMGIETSYTIKKNAEDYNGVSIEYGKLVMRPTDFTSPQGQMIDAMYTDGLHCRSAIVNGLCVCTIGGNADTAIHHLIDDIRSGELVQTDPEITAALALLPQADKADFMVTLNYVRLLKMGLAMSRMVGQLNIPQIDFPSKSNIAIASKVEAGKMIIDAAMPKEHLTEIVKVFQIIQQGVPAQAAGTTNEIASANEPATDSPNDVNLPVTGAIRAFDSNSLSAFPIADGWPIALPGAVTGTPVAADLDGDGDLEVVVPCMDRGYWKQHPKIDVSHPNPDISAQLFAFHHDGTLVEGWPVVLADKQMRELSRSEKPSRSENWNSSPSVMDLNGDGSDEVVIANCEARRSVWILNGDGTPREFPQGTGLSDPWTSVPLIDIDMDGVIDLILGEVHTTVEGGPISEWPESRMFHKAYAPCVGDADGDGELEFYMPFYSKQPITGYDRFGNILPGWPKMTGRQCVFPPVMGDVTGDGRMEICNADWKNNIMLWTWDGQSVLPEVDPNDDPNNDPNIFKKGIYSHWASPSLADLNNDGKAEIIIFDCRTRTLRAWYSDGKGVVNDEGIIAALLEARCFGGVTVGDLGGDGEMDFFVNTFWVRLSQDNTVKITNMLPKSQWSTTQCTITDIDLDGQADILFGLADGRVFVYNTDKLYNEEWMQWSTQSANFRHTGVWRRLN